MERRWRGNATAAGCFSDGANCHDDLAVECRPARERGEEGNKNKSSKQLRAGSVFLFSWWGD